MRPHGLAGVIARGIDRFSEGDLPCGCHLRYDYDGERIVTPCLTHKSNYDPNHHDNDCVSTTPCPLSSCKGVGSWDCRTCRPTHEVSRAQHTEVDRQRRAELPYNDICHYTGPFAFGLCPNCHTGHDHVGNPRYGRIFREPTSCPRVDAATT